jgi:hypothetical protein
MKDIILDITVKDPKTEEAWAVVSTDVLETTEDRCGTILQLMMALDVTPPELTRYIARSKWRELLGICLDCFTENDNTEEGTEP